MVKLCGIGMVVFMISGCSNVYHTAKPIQPVALTQLMVAQCRVYERAFRQTYKTIAERRYSIVEGCPRRKQKGIKNTSVFASFFLENQRHKAPDFVRKDPEALKLFQELRSRGTPALVAVGVADSPEFKVAVNVARF